MGSFALPTMLLLAIAHHHDWNLEIMPYAGSEAESRLKHYFELGPKLDWTKESTGMNDVSNRDNFNPMELNRNLFDVLGFFPKESIPWDETLWTPIDKLPSPGGGGTLAQICHNQTVNDLSRRNTTTENCNVTCRLLMGDLPDPMREYMKQNGGIDAFFTESLREIIRQRYVQKNRHRLKHYSSQDYNVAMHVRRGDIVNPSRWTTQEVFAKVARRICSSRTQQNTVIHVFSSGVNRDGGWSELEQVRDTCKNVTFHMDEFEFDTWAHLTVADELVISKSTFGYVPALISAGKIHAPHDFWHTPLAHWELFRNSDGEKIA